MPILLKIQPSKNPNKKYAALFRLPENKFKTVLFGDPKAEDYLQHKDLIRRDRYLKRHEKDLKTNDPLRPGYLSYYISWSGFKQEGKPTRNKSKLIKMYNFRFFKKT